MIKCGYCGRENQDGALSCTGCGTALPEVGAESSTAADKRSLAERLFGQVLDARYASLILLTTLGTEILCAAVIVSIVLLLAGKDFHSSYQLGLLVSKVAPTILLVAPAVGLMVVLQLSFKAIPGYLTDISPCGAALVLGPPSEIRRGILFGTLIAAFVTGLGMIPGLHLRARHLGGFERMALSNIWSVAIWVIGGVVLAPVVEEVLFRGVVYGGYRKSFGPNWAAALTTFHFVAAHLPNAAFDVAFLVGLFALSLASLSCRLSSNAIGPAIGVHFGYNLMAMVAMFALRSRLPHN